MSSNMRIPKICEHCGKDYIAKTTVTKYCSDTCAKRAYKKRKRNEKVKALPNMVEQKIAHTRDALQQKEFLSIKETCGLLGMSRMTLYRQIKSGHITAAQMGRRVIISRCEIEKLFAE
ncbi:MAG: helix-turn-helix domain-containing protein [Bacteroidia bacterium]